MAGLEELMAEYGASALSPAGPWVVSVPSEKRGALGVQVAEGERTVRLRAFVIRAPDRNRREVYARLLRKNLDAAGWRFALDDSGDVFLAADEPRGTLSADRLDDLLGAAAVLVDEVYEGVFRTGFDVPPSVTVGRPPEAPPVT